MVVTPESVSMKCAAIFRTDRPLGGGGGIGGANSAPRAQEICTATMASAANATNATSRRASREPPAKIDKGIEGDAPSNAAYKLAIGTC